MLLKAMSTTTLTPGLETFMKRKHRQLLDHRRTTGFENSKEKNQAMNEQPKMAKTFSWRHLNYAVSVSGERRLLLDDVSGFVAPRKLTVLMGESGAGKVWSFLHLRVAGFDFRVKTTLLNVLAERAGTGIISGDLFFNGQALPVDFEAQTGYCQQMDTHVSLTTVCEALVFSARLRQPASLRFFTSPPEYSSKKDRKPLSF